MEMTRSVAAAVVVATDLVLIPVTAARVQQVVAQAPVAKAVRATTRQTDRKALLGETAAEASTG